ncbi:MAG TPA: HAD-IIIC family phosphatase [Armatimonadota bacterium]|jgi:FkbH-like protein
MPVKVTEALKILHTAPEAAPYRVGLACGFTPLHLQTFLAAHVQQRLPSRRVEVTPGVYGDVPGNIEGFDPQAAHAMAVALEWSDLDPRLGYRSAGRWGVAALSDILQAARAMAGRIAGAIERLAPGIPVAVSLPTLPLPPVFHTTGWQSAQAELALQQILLDAASRLAGRPGCLLVNASRLAEESPQAGRLDFKSELLTGLPYTVPHASAVGCALARLLAPAPPKKGLITDLDDTLWRDIAGEVGPQGVSWDLAGHSQLHGLYQKLLASLAEEGVLVGVASKNDPAVVRQVFEREDFLLPPARVFPVEAHWSAKSGSVARILEQWNIGPENVVFVDDSPMELAEVAGAHPGIECVLFPKKDYAAGYAMLRRLRDLFGKPRIAEEDGLRLESLRQAEAFREIGGDRAAADVFLRQANAAISVDSRLSAAEPRVLELVNKTNQFNLNGIRYTEADWRERLSRPGAFLMVAAYRDRFGPLGKIAAIQGCRSASALRIETWVMSCRAFSRRIEHRCLKWLFDRYPGGEIVFDFAATPRNGPLQDFFAAFLPERPSAPFTLARERFEAACPPLFHEVIESETSTDPWTLSQPA